MSNRFDLIDSGGIDVPDGATVLEVNTFHTSAYQKDDTPTEQLVMDVNGHNVEVIRYDYSDKGVVIIIDNNAKSMTMDKVNGYIRSHTK